MKKQKLSNSFQEMKLGNYFRELSIVIIGVAVTLFVGNVITGVKEKKDLRLHLVAIYNELEYNFKEINSITEYNENTQLLRKYLLESVENPQSGTNDSIRKYEKVAWMSYWFEYKKDAYDMFVNSGAMKLLDNRELLLDITASYSMLESQRILNEKRMNSKMQIIQDIYKLEKKDLFAKDMELLTPAMSQLFNFQALYQGSEDITHGVKSQIEKTLSGNLKQYKQTK